jgi:hypothetical protein
MRSFSVKQLLAEDEACRTKVSMGKMARAAAMIFCDKR